MICPRCKELGNKSSVTVGYSMSTLMYCPPYYDSEGILHNHDSNHHTATYTCSGGHDISVSSIRKCPSCSYGSDKEVVTVRDREPITISNVDITSFTATAGNVPITSGATSTATTTSTTVTHGNVTYTIEKGYLKKNKL